MRIINSVSHVKFVFFTCVQQDVISTACNRSCESANCTLDSLHMKNELKIVFSDLLLRKT